jgi:hypothetical protein
MVSRWLTLVFCSLAAVLFFAGCNSGRPATTASTDLYVQALLKRMGKFGPVKVWHDSRGTVGYSMTRTINFTVPAKNFPPSRLGGEMAATFQEMSEGYQGRGEDGSGGEYGFQYGDGHTGAFIDGQATQDGENVQIRIAVRVVE